MPLFASLIGPISSIIDKVIPDKAARDKAKLDLLTLQGAQEMQQIQTQLSAIVAEANSTDPWTSRARPSFLYVMYVMILWALPMGVLSAFRPDTARDIASGMNAYLAGLPEPLYTLFG
ncbi:MAG: holin family protein, partial [Porphyrobacter sp.]|nr:holin family protein [Porphyrobacter sp.]